MDKIIPDVHQLWVGKDFFALFIKFFGSLGLKDPIFATVALATVSSLEALNFVFYLLSFANFLKGNDSISEKWFFRAIFSSITLFSLFSIADQVFGDRFQLLEHGLFWLILIASWVLFKHISSISEEKTISFQQKKGLMVALFTGTLITIITSFSIVEFSNSTFSNVNSAVEGHEVIEDVYKFDFPFLADKLVWEKTINSFKENHPELKINYIYTGPSELNSKKKTHLLLYVFTEKIISNTEPEISKENLVSDISPFNGEGDVNALIEIPAGTIDKWEVNKSNGQLEWETVNGNPRKINYLGYPGNYGMVPKTLLPKKYGGDGDPLDIIVLGPPAERGEIVKCKIIGVLNLLDRNEKDDKLIAVANNSPFYLVNNIQELDDNFEGISEIVKTWFTNYKGKGKMKSSGFGDKNDALKILNTAISEYNLVNN